MEGRGAVSFETDRALVEAMLLVGEPLVVVEDFLLCLELTEDERQELRRIARSQRATMREPEIAWPSAGGTGIASGDVIEMNPLTSQPQRAKPR